MGARDGLKANPKAYASPKGFPDLVADAPVAVTRCVKVLAAIDAITSEHGVREAARRAGISHSTLSRTIAGEVWPSFVTIASLEEAFGVELWK